LDWIIVDHYGIDKNWHADLRPFTKKIMVIDDLAIRSHDCDLLLDQNYYQNQLIRYRSLVDTHTECLLGPDFALLRKEFQQLRRNIKKRDGKVKRILIFFGGGDCSKAIIKSIKACLKLSKIHFEFDVIANTACSNLDEIRQLCLALGARYFCQIENIAELMAQADLAIGGGGVSIWERCCLGLPSIVMSIADNQIAVAKDASKLGVIKYLGELEHVNEKQIYDCLLLLTSDAQAIMEMSANARHLVDGKGCEKVVDKLYEH
jgi:UDP-2,4-diacetamido-2,4,6-trideoxy-beta-L-altropyranose hydrolase